MSMPRYITAADITTRLYSKLTVGGTSPYALTTDLLNDYIALAETEVENDFSPFYLIPIQGQLVPGDPLSPLIPWASILTTYPQFQGSVDYFRGAFIAKACLNVLLQEFGRFDNVQATNAMKQYDKIYADALFNLRAKTSTGRYINPTKPGIAYNPASFIMNTSMPAPTTVKIGWGPNNLPYAQYQIIDPSSTWYNLYVGPSGWPRGGWPNNGPWDRR